MVIGMAAVEAFVVFFYFFSFRALKRTFNVLRQWCKDKDSECVVLINGLRALKGLPPVEDEPEEDESENTEDKTEQP